MKNYTIISYTTPQPSLLTLSESRSSYMLPFAGRFRVVDFTMRNAISSGASKIILYNSTKDSLKNYIKKYRSTSENNPFDIEIINNKLSNLQYFQEHIGEDESSFYIIVNGDIATVTNMKILADDFKKSKTDKLLYQLVVNDRPSMAYKILFIKKRALISTIKKAVKLHKDTPNIFEMFHNILINSGIKTRGFRAIYWPVRTINDYYNMHWDIIWDKKIFDMLFKEKVIKSEIKSTGFAHIGDMGKITDSFISDYCFINGTIENSIIYPGVHIEQGAVIKDSVILPNVKIGQNVKITKSIIDERTDFTEEDDYFSVEHECRIGTSQEHIKNDRFPADLYSSITLIGKNNRIPKGSWIGGACYIVAEGNLDYFTKNNNLYDGSSILKKITD